LLAASQSRAQRLRAEAQAKRGNPFLPLPRTDPTDFETQKMTDRIKELDTSTNLTRQLQARNRRRRTQMTAASQVARVKARICWKRGAGLTGPAA
jgi:hypothetical protein